MRSTSPTGSIYSGKNFLSPSLAGADISTTSSHLQSSSINENSVPAPSGDPSDINRIQGGKKRKGKKKKDTGADLRASAGQNIGKQLRSTLAEQKTAAATSAEEETLKKLQAIFKSMAYTIKDAFEPEKEKADRFFSEEGVDTLPNRFLLQDKLTSQKYISPPQKDLEELKDKFNGVLTEKVESKIAAMKLVAKRYIDQLHAVQNYYLACAYFRSGQHSQALNHATEAIKIILDSVDLSDKKDGDYPDNRHLSVPKINKPSADGTLVRATSKTVIDILAMATDIARAVLPSGNLLNTASAEHAAAFSPQALARELTRATVSILNRGMFESGALQSDEKKYVDLHSPSFRYAGDTSRNKENTQIQTKALQHIDTLFKRVNELDADVKIRIDELDMLLKNLDVNYREFGKEYLYLQQLRITPEIVRHINIHSKLQFTGAFITRSKKNAELLDRFNVVDKKAWGLIHMLCGSVEFLKVSNGDFKDLENWNKNVQSAVLQELQTRFSSLAKQYMDFSDEFEKSKASHPPEFIETIKEASKKYEEINESISTLINLDSQFHSTHIAEKDRNIAQIIVRDTLRMEEENLSNAAAAEAELKALLEKEREQSGLNEPMKNERAKTSEAQLEGSSGTSLEIASPLPAVEQEKPMVNKSGLQKELVSKEQRFKEENDDYKERIKGALSAGRNSQLSLIDREDEMEWAASILGGQIESKKHMIALRTQLIELKAKNASQLIRRNETDQKFIKEAELERDSYATEGKEIRLTGTFRRLEEEFNRQPQRGETFIFPYEEFAYMVRCNQNENSNQKFITFINSPESRLGERSSTNQIRAEKDRDIIREIIVKIKIPGQNASIDLALHDHLNCETRELKFSNAKLERDRLLGSSDDVIISHWKVRPRDQSKLKGLLEASTF